MCGIAGLVGWEVEESRFSIGPMTRALAHRGPDGEAFWHGHGVSFGHRRLSIIDLSSDGDQPMTANDERYILVYNGELYNYPELKRELLAKGHRFSSRSDTEVMLRSLVEWGTDAIPRFNGMFAFAFWDSYRRELILARDRYGIKPLYVAARNGRLAFASEAKAIATLPGFASKLDKTALVEYFNFQNLFTNRTFFEGVSVFPAGSFAKIRLNERSEIDVPLEKCTTQYWDFDFQEPTVQHADPQEYVEELARLFEAAVSRQIVADVPVASYLSGGLDTGGITAVAAKLMPMMRSFTVGFDMSSASGLEQGFDEREQAERMSYLCGTEQYEMVLKAGDMERCMRPLVHALEELRVGQSYPNYYAAQLASKFGKVVLSGSGGDELFAGYPWRYYRPAAAVDFNGFTDQYFSFWQRLIPSGQRKQILVNADQAIESTVDPRSIFTSVFPDHGKGSTRVIDFINLSLYFEAKTFLHGLLVVEDKLSMAHGLESRVPMLDNDLVDFATKLPMSLKLSNLSQIPKLDENMRGAKTETFFQEHRDGKLILRQMLGRHVGPVQATMRKQGFSGPDAGWFRSESLDYVKRTLTPASPLFDILDRQTFLPLVEEHLSGTANHRLLVWSLLSFQTWLEVFG